MASKKGKFLDRPVTFMHLLAAACLYVGYLAYIDHQYLWYMVGMIQSMGAPH